MNSTGQAVGIYEATTAHICSFILYFSFSDNITKKGHSSRIRKEAIIFTSSTLVMGILILGAISYVWKKKLSFKGKAIRYALVISDA